MLCAHYLRARPVGFDGCDNRRSMKGRWFAPVPEIKNWERLQMFPFFTSILHTYICNLSRMVVKLQKASGVL